MGKALRVLGRGFLDLYEELWPLAGASLLWFAIGMLPLMVLVGVSDLLGGWWLALVPVTLVGLPPATAGVFAVASAVLEEKVPEVGVFWEGFRRYLGTSWWMALIFGGAGVILGVDVLFYLRQAGFGFLVLGLMGGWLLLVLVMMQVYAWPLLVRMEDPKRLWQLVKNAALLCLAFPLFTFVVLLGVLIFTAVCVVLVLPLAVVWMPGVAVISHRALAVALGEAERIRKAREVVEAEMEGDESSEA